LIVCNNPSRLCQQEI